MIRVLNQILLTSPELQALRTHIRQTATNAEAHKLFQILFRAWTNNPVATFSLCLLAEQYELANAVVQQFAHLDITIGILEQIDKFAHLLESPLFMGLRLQLLDPPKHPFLLRALYGMLMVMPQSPAFERLSQRLTAVMPFHNQMALIALSNTDREQDSAAGAAAKPAKSKKGSVIAQTPPLENPLTIDIDALTTHFIQTSDKAKAENSGPLQ